jgi:hypothetical protein
MLRFRLESVLLAASMLSLACAIGCGTTRSTDTGRTATEQLLLSDAIDRAVQTVNFTPLAGQTVYVDDARLEDVVDRQYLLSTLRQHLLASGCALRDKREDAEFIIEPRAGAIGTDRNDLLFGVPSMNVPQILPVQPVPAAIPEIPVAKRRDQRGIAKIAVFAYHRETGRPVWQSGLAQKESSSNDVWILGAGPFQRGTIYEGTSFAGNTLGEPGVDEKDDKPKPAAIALADEKLFASPARLAVEAQPAPNASAVVPARYAEASAPMTQSTSPAESRASPASPVAPRPFDPRGTSAVSPAMR